MKKFKEYFYIAFFGAIGYSSIEIFWRGYTHWTMAVTGGAGFLCVYLMAEILRPCSFWQKCLVGSVLLTTLELSVGQFVNLKMGWQVWDYSRLRWNLCGQICPLYSLYWLILCMLLLPICTWLRMQLCTKN